MIDVFGKIKSHTGKKFIYGTGDGADKLIDFLESLHIKVDGVCVSDDFYRKRQFRGFELLPISKAWEENPDGLFLMAFGTKITDDIFALNEKINLIYPEVPVCGNNPFTYESLMDNMDRIKRAYSILADEQSRLVYESIIRFRLTGDITFLKKCESPIEEGYSLITSDTCSETIFDCGAYTGDTAKDFEKYCGDIKEFYAVEPCPKSFLKLKNLFGGRKNYHLFNCAAGENEGVAEFIFSRGRGSALTTNSVATAGKTTLTQIQSVDGILNGKECTIIKYDVEGEEAPALLGSQKTIKNCRPKLLVAAYHRSEDLYEIPLLLESICSGYKIYLRHHPCLPSWETNVYALY